MLNPAQSKGFLKEIADFDVNFHLQHAISLSAEFLITNELFLRKLISIFNIFSIQNVLKVEFIQRIQHCLAIEKSVDKTFYQYFYCNLLFSYTK